MADDARSFLERKLKDIESNLQRFPDRAETYLKEATDKLATLDNSYASIPLQSEFNPKLEKYRNVLVITKARKARRADGSCLEYGLSHHLDRFTGALKSPPLTNTKSHEKEVKFVEERKLQKDLLVQWLETFKADYGSNPEANDTIIECENALKLCDSTLEEIRVPLMIKMARNARKNDGSCLEYGLSHHLDRFVGSLKDGVPGNPRKDNEYIEARTKQNELLVEWLEDFKSKHGEYEEANETIRECEEALSLFKKVVGAAQIPLMIQNARNARRADGSCLEYGLDYHLKNFNGHLNDGIPGNPRQPQKDNEYIEARTKQNELLVEWLEDFKSKHGEYEEANETIRECEEALSLFKKVVGAAKVPLMIQNARNARRADGSCLEYGLDYHLKNFNGHLNDGIPGNPRKDNEYIEARTKQNELLVEWLEDFKSKHGEYEEANETIRECEEALSLFKKVVGAAQIPLMIQNARNARRADGSCLEYGLDYHLKNFNGHLNDGIPGNPRQPQKDNEYIEARTKQNELLVEWLEDFKSKCGEYEEANETIRECEEALSLFKKVVGAAQIPLMIQNARNARRADGSCLEYGLDYHLKNFNGKLEEGIPDSRSPEKANEWIAERLKQKELLVQWLENFKSSLGEYSEAQETIQECEDSLERYLCVVDSVRIPLLIKNARHARRADGSCLEYGLDYHLKNFNGKLEEGIPGKSPDKDNEWVAERVKQNELLVEWLEDFKSKFQEYEESAVTIQECEMTLDRYKQVVESVRVPLMIQTARSARRADGSCLEYGLDFHLKGMNSELEKGLPGNTNRPEQDNAWMEKMFASKELLVQWLENFKSSFNQYQEAWPTIDECEIVLQKLNEIVGKLKIPLEIQNARNARKADGSVLEYGLKYHLEHFKSALESGLPKQSGFPERDNEWMEARSKDKDILIEWLEGFKAKFHEFDEASNTIRECEEILDSYRTITDPYRIPLLIQNAKNARKAQGSCLEYGLDFHLKSFHSALEKGIPGNKRFPERDNEWIAERTQQKEKLVEWLENFKSEFAQYPLANETIVEVEKALLLYNETVSTLKIPLDIQNARNARKSNGSPLEYGFDHHVTSFNSLLSSGYPNASQIKNEEWLKRCTIHRNLLVEWLEDFKSKFQEYEESHTTITTCEELLQKYSKQVSAIKIPLDIQKARNARKAQGSSLEYGLDYHLKIMNSHLDNGVPGVKRFQERDNEWLSKALTHKELLVNWLEDFRSKFEVYSEATDIITECEKILNKSNETIEPIRVPLMIQNARNERIPNLVPYGLDFLLQNLSTKLEKGLPNDSRFPDRNIQWMGERSKDKENLVNWLETFRANFSQFSEASQTISECENILCKYESVVGKLFLPIQIQQAVNRRDTKFSLTLDTQIIRFVQAIEKGIPGDSRFPERDNQYMDDRRKEYSALVDRIEELKANFGDHPDASPFIKNAEVAFHQYNHLVSTVAVPLAVKNARYARDPSGLQYGLDYHMKQLNNELEREITSMDLTRTKILYNQLLDWLENFKSQFMEHVIKEHPLVLETIAEAEKLMKKYKTTVSIVTVPIAVAKAKKSSHILRYGLDYHLKRFQIILDSDAQSVRIDEATKFYSQLIEWLEHFKQEFKHSLDLRVVHETISTVESMLRQFTLTIGGKKALRDMKLAVDSRTILPYGLEYQIKLLSTRISSNQGGNDSQKAAGLLMIWQEDFRSRFEYVTGASEILKRVQSILDQFRVQFPREAAQQIRQHQKRKVSTSRSVPGSAEVTAAVSTGIDDEIDEIPSIAVSVVSEAKEPLNAPHRISIIPDIIDAPCVGAYAVDRTIPSMLSRGEGYMKELLKKQNSVQESLSKGILLAVDWSFVGSDPYNALSEEEQHKVSQNLVFTFISRAVLADSGFVGICQGNKISRDIMVPQVSVIKIMYDINSRMPGDFEFTLSGAELKLIFNFSCWNKNLDTKVIQETLETLFDLKYLHALSQLQSQSESTGNALQKTLERENKILVQIEKSFLALPDFVSLDSDKKIILFEKLTKLMKSLLITSGGLSDLCEKSKTMKRFVFENICEISLSYVPTSKITSKKGYEINFDSNSGLLTFWADIQAKEIKLTDLDQSFDLALGLVSLKAIDASKSKIQAYQNIITRKIKANILIQIEWNNWMNHPNFLAYDIPKQTAANQAILQKHTNELINGEEGLIEFFNENVNLHSVLLRKLKLIRIKYDPTNSISYNHSRNYPFFILSFDHFHCTLDVIGNLNAFQGKPGHGWKDFATKALPIFETAAVRFSYDSQLRGFHRTQIFPMLEANSLSISIDWDSFVNSDAFLSLTKPKRDAILQSIKTKHYPNLFEQLQKVCSHQIGKKAIQLKVKKFIITTNENCIPSETKSNLFSDHYSFDESTGTFSVFIPFSELTNSASKYVIRDWQIRWALGISIDVAKDLGIQKIEEHRATASKKIEKEILINFDWEFLTSSEFLRIGPQPIVSTIEKLSDDLVYQVFHRGLFAICSHPIGKKCIHENIKEVSITYSPKSISGQTDSTLKVQGNTLAIAIAQNNLTNACCSRYKERIEFEYDLIVAIAKDNAIGVLHSIENQIEELTKQKIPISVELQNFTPLPVFRTKIPSDQADIITALYATLQKQILSSGLCEFLRYGTEVSVLPFLSKVSSIEFHVDPENKISSKEGIITLKGSILVFTFNLNNVLSCVSVGNWKERILVVLEMLVDVSRFETKKERESIENELRGDLGAPGFTVTVDWDGFIHSPEFLSNHATKQVHLIKSANVEMLRDSLLGSSGFSQSKGLCEFSETGSFINERITSIVISIKPSGEYLNVDSSTKTLQLCYSLDSLNQNDFIGCHENLEKFMKLRPIKQASAIARAEKRIANDCSTLIRDYCPVQIVWESFINTIGKGYVQMIDEVASVPKQVFMGREFSFGNVGISALVSRSASLGSALKRFKLIQLVLDPRNTVRVKVGKAKTLLPNCFRVTGSGTTLCIESNLQTRLEFAGVARVVQFALCSAEAHRDEENTISQRAAQMLRDEQDRRAREIQYANDKNNEIIKQNARDQENYQKEMQEYHKMQNQKCNYSQCKGGYNKCGVCSGRGHNTNNKITRACSSCGGQGQRVCGHCNGTQKRYPNGPRLPSVPSSRSLQSIPTFGSLPDYRAHI